MLNAEGAEAAGVLGQGAGGFEGGARRWARSPRRHSFPDCEPMLRLKGVSFESVWGPVWGWECVTGRVWVLAHGTGNFCEMTFRQPDVWGGPHGGDP